ncbi:MAG TPA: nitrate- and nitrite sensing domain-containing protein [Pseudonocardiaceae bacterium]|nr:nitrate- and nitrite sensing domain-containing protein [Pseudonocardiaceae bacterium]
MQSVGERSAQSAQLPAESAWLAQSEPAPALRTSRREVGRSWFATFLDWRNWRLRAKVSALLLLPVLASVVAGGLLISTEMDHADTYQNLEQLVALRGTLTPLLAGIQRERTDAADLLVNSGMSDPTEFNRQAGQDDAAVANIGALAESTPNLGEAATNEYHTLTSLFGGLPALRREVLGNAVDATDATLAYSAINRGVLSFDQALASQFADPSLSGPATTLYDLELAQEQVGRQQAIVMAAIGRGHLLVGEENQLQQADLRWQDYLTDFQAAATSGEAADYQRTVSGPAVTNRELLEQAALSAGTGSVAELSMSQWQQDSDATMAALSQVQDRIAGQLQDTAATLKTQTSQVAWTATVALVVLIVLVAAIGFLLGRHLLRSLRMLRRSALDVADNRLPAAVASILAGGNADTAIERVPLRTTEEFGQLARAFDKMQIQAVQLAVEQASLRDNMRNILVNLSRRSQTLVERQLWLMEELEQHEEGPEQLANLFKLDHLATRMRRNNENLMVLSGAELGRRFTEPVPIADVLRAAVSETEDYQRMVVRATPDSRIVGYAAGDLVRLLAELLDNAAAFSPPNTEVVLASHDWERGSVLIEVIDQGLGIIEDENLAEANGKVVASGAADVPVSRQMGLYVVGRLACRHNINVRLLRNSYGVGLRASVLVPAELVPVEFARQQSSVPAPSPSFEEQDTMVFEAPIRLNRPRARRPKSSGRQTNGHASVEIDTIVGELSHNGAVDISAPEPSRPQPSDVDDPEFIWFSADRTVDPAPNGAADREIDQTVDPTGPTPNGSLPKRVPRANLQENLTAQQRRDPDSGDSAAGARDAHRVRNFLSSYQSGLQASRRDLTTESGETT